MAETRWEWAVVYGVDTADLISPVEGNILGYDDETSARDMLQWLADSMVVRRRVAAGPWVPAPDADPGEGPGLTEPPADWDPLRVATGVLPADAEWDRAQAVYEAAGRALAASPEAAVPQPVRDAVDALGGLLGVWHGYGEDDDG